MINNTPNKEVTIVRDVTFELYKINDSENTKEEKGSSGGYDNLVHLAIHNIGTSANNHHFEIYVKHGFNDAGYLVSSIYYDWRTKVLTFK